MIDLHCHLLPGLDDGPPDLETALQMARLAVADGVEVAACTPHILPGVYHNTGPQILAATNALRRALADAGIRLELISGADAHMTPAFVSKLDAGEILTLGQSRYVLIELPRHVAPIRMEAFFFDILDAGYVPILTHPERLIWICDRYTMIERLAFSGVWMQITAGSLTGRFGSRARYWAERMLAEGIVHILASDAHDALRRPPDLSRGWEAAARWVGHCQATHLVSTRPRGVIKNEAPSNLPLPFASVAASFSRRA
jgi:protein-tyrosine phosphatase